MNGVLVDRALLERLAKHADALNCAEESAPRKLRERAAEDAVSLRAVLALPAQAAAPELVKEAREVAARLPTDGRADWWYTNHFELNGSGEYPWLTLADTQALDDTEYGQRVGAVLDAAAMLPRLVTALLPAQAAADAAGVQGETLTLLRAAQSALEPYMRVIPGTGEPGVLNEAAQVAQRISTYLAQEVQG